MENRKNCSDLTLLADNTSKAAGDNFALEFGSVGTNVITCSESFNIPTCAHVGEEENHVRLFTKNTVVLVTHYLCNTIESTQSFQGNEPSKF